MTAKAKFTLPEYLLCIDPGRVTGLALYQADQGGNVVQVWSAEGEFVEACDKINETLAEYGPRCRVLYEKYIITIQTAKKSPQPWSLEVIGVAKWLAARYKAESVVSQTSSKAKMFCPNSRLRDLGFWHRGGDHGRDALRHGVTHLVECGWRHPKILS